LDAALALYERFIKCFEMLAEMPHAGRRRDELEVNLRSLPEGHYVLFYRETADGVEIIRVLHGARDIQSMFDN
jgi:toxin ParE1/3/4